MPAYAVEAWDDNTTTGSFSSESAFVHGPFDRGMIDFSEVVGFIRRNYLRIGIVTAVLTAVFLILYSLYPFPYRATAMVLVDPRERRVTLTENVLSGIGSDAAILESVVRIVRSDGFLRPVLEKLEAKNDPIFGSSVAQSDPDGRKLLAAFKNKLEVDRVGATFIVEISFTSNSAEKSAFYANAVAQAFVDSQSQSHTSANEFATASLLERLQVLRTNLEASEKAVAQFKAENGIIAVTQDSTLLQRELIALNEQIAVASAARATAYAQYEQLRNGNGASGAIELSNDELLTELRRERGQVLQTLSEFGRVYGDRHPRITAERSKLAGIDRQIAEEKTRLIASLKERLESSVSTLKALEAEQKKLKEDALGTEEARVQLGSLEREATANRNLYEEFLGRFKATEEQSGIEIEQAQIASPATPPLRTTRPSKILAALVFGVLAGFIATLYAIFREVFFARLATPNQVSVERIATKTRLKAKPALRSPVDQGSRSPRLLQAINKTRHSQLEFSLHVQSFDEIVLDLSNVRKHRDGSHDPMIVAQELLQGPLRHELKSMLRPGAVIVLSSRLARSGGLDIAMGLAVLAGLQSVPTLLLSADKHGRRGNHAGSAHRAAIDEFPISIVDPKDFAMRLYKERRPIRDIIEGFGISRTSTTSCLIVNAPMVRSPGDLEQLAEFSDYLFLTEHAGSGLPPVAEKIPYGNSQGIQRKLRLIKML